MNRYTMLRWLGAGALGLVLVAGCSHSGSTSARSASSTTAACGCPCAQCQGTAVAIGSSNARSVPMYTSAASVPAPSYGNVPTPKINSDIVQVSAKETVKEAGPTVPDMSTIGLKSTFTRGEPAPTRKSYVDITAASCFSHAPDYGTICGQLEHSRAANIWRLRYLSVDDSDAFGGSVTLTGDPTVLGALKDGQHVKVQGHLINPDQKGIAPAYRIESVEGLHSTPRIN